MRHQQKLLLRKGQKIGKTLNQVYSFKKSRTYCPTLVLYILSKSKFRLQLYDILGYAQTEDSHAAVLKAIYLDKEEHLDYNERYLWALSLSPSPNPDILKDLLKKFIKSNNLPSKVKETLILTIASMARKLYKIPTGNAKASIHNIANIFSFRQVF